MRSSLHGELKPAGRNKSIMKPTNNRHLIHHVLPLYTLLFCTNIIYYTVWPWHCQNMFTICFMNAGSQVIDAVKYQSLTLQTCNSAWILNRWHQQTKALISLVCMTGPEVPWCLCTNPSKEALIKKNKTERSNIFSLLWVCFQISQIFVNLEPFLEIKMTDEQVQKKITLLQRFLIQWDLWGWKFMMSN